MALSASLDLTAATRLLERWVDALAPDPGRAWLAERRREIAGGAPDWKFFTAFSAAPRHVGKADLAMPDAERADAARARPGWDPTGWSVDQAARSLLVLTAADHAEVGPFAARLDKLFKAADVRESVALYSALPILPHGEAHHARAVEGLRTNMQSVFEAIALRSPYPRERFTEHEWNQMVLKAVFIGSELGAIQGFDERANPDLARMLVDYAHERWAAGRPVADDLWRAVEPFADRDRRVAEALAERDRHA